MTIDTKDLLESIKKSLNRIDYVHPEDIPNIDLYMDQVTTFMEDNLKNTKRYPEDKVLTKTMINNYSKNNLLPPSIKKKYTKEHVLLLIFVYYFKNILSIKDIDTLLSPITDKYFAGDDSFDMKDIYVEACKMQKNRVKELEENIEELYHEAEECYTDAPEGDREYLQLFAFICNLAFDVYIKKQLIEKLIDELPEPTKKKKK